MSVFSFEGGAGDPILVKITANTASNHVTTFTHFSASFFERHPFTNP